MRSQYILCRGIVIVLSVLAFYPAAGWTQSTGSTPGSGSTGSSSGSTGSSYPYRGTAPSSYHGSTVTTPAPTISPSTVSNSAHSSAEAGHSASYGGIGGAYLPPFLTAADVGSRKPPKALIDTKAHLWFRVPAEAQVWVDGVRTRQTGESRYFYSPSLTPGRKYAYEVRVRWMKDGKPVEENHRIIVSAGSTIRKDFTRADETASHSAEKESSRP